MLTKKELGEYISLEHEIKILGELVLRWEEELHRAKKVDTVMGSSPEFPFICHPIQVTGGDEKLFTEHKAKIAHLKERIAAHQNQMRHLEDYIHSINDSETRQILVLRYLSGFSWEKVARKMGEGYTGDAARKRHDRFLRF